MTVLFTFAPVKLPVNVFSAASISIPSWTARSRVSWITQYAALALQGAIHAAQAKRKPPLGGSDHRRIDQSGSWKDTREYAEQRDAMIRRIPGRSRIAMYSSASKPS